MPKYFFHFHSAQGDALDPMGIDIDDDFAAGQAGLAGVRGLLSEAIEARAAIDLSSRFRIVDEHGREVIEIAYADLLKVA